MPETRVVIEEIRRDWIDGKMVERIVNHLPVGRSVNEFQPVKCGGGINMHGSRKTVDKSEVCDDCLNGRVTL